MAYTYPQIFLLERPPFTLAYQEMPDTSLCTEGGNPSTGLPIPCSDCPDKIPFAPQDIFDIQYPETITSVVIRLPNGTVFPNTGILNYTQNRLRIAFCNAPPCFSVEINNQCTVLAFERIPCFESCAETPPTDPPNPIDPPETVPMASFVSIEHVRLADNVAFSTHIPGYSDAVYSYVRYPNNPVTFTASSVVGMGGAVADHLHATTTGALVTAQITVGVAAFVGWSFDTPPVMALGYTPSGFYSPAPLPPTLVSGTMTSPNITFVVPPGTYIRARALFGQNTPITISVMGTSTLHAYFRIHNLDLPDVLAPIPEGYQIAATIEFEKTDDAVKLSIIRLALANTLVTIYPSGDTRIVAKFYFFIRSGELLMRYDFLNPVTNTTIFTGKYFCIGQYVPNETIDLIIIAENINILSHDAVLEPMTPPQFGVNSDALYINNWGTTIVSYLSHQYSNVYGDYYTVTAKPIANYRLKLDYTLVVQDNGIVNNTLSVQAMMWVPANSLTNYPITITGTETLSLTVIFESFGGNVYQSLQLFKNSSLLLSTPAMPLSVVDSGFIIGYPVDLIITLNDSTGTTIFQSATGTITTEAI